MNRLIRAEAYRFRHTGSLFWISIIGAAVFLVLPFFMNMDMLNEPLDELISSVGISTLFFLNFFPAVAAGFSGQLFNKGRIGYYEIMAGNSPASIIMSKIFTDGVFFSAIAIVSTSFFYIFIGMKNGLGSVDMPVLRLILYSVIMIRIVTVCILIMMTSKKAVPAALLAYIRFMIIDSAALPMLMYIANFLGFEKLGNHISLMVTVNQLDMAALAPLETPLILHIIIGFVVEFIIWYVLAYMGLKKKHIA